jgi:hypothetical protein
MTDLVSVRLEANAHDVLVVFRLGLERDFDSARGVNSPTAAPTHIALYWDGPISGCFARNVQTFGANSITVCWRVARYTTASGAAAKPAAGSAMGLQPTRVRVVALTTQMVESPRWNSVGRERLRAANSGRTRKSPTAIVRWRYCCGDAFPN